MKARIVLPVAAAALALAPGTASAAALRIVDNTPASVCKAGTGAPFTTIQAAVDAAAPSDSVIVCPGTYTEQVHITTNGLRLQGNTSYAATIRAPGGLTRTDAIVHVDGAANVVVTKFSISGPGSGPDSLGEGVLVDNGATGARIVDNHISAIRDQPLGATQHGEGILFGHSDYTGEGVGTGSGIAQDNVISDYQDDGIVAGGLGSVVNATRNTITGSGAYTYGIWYVGVAAGTILNNSVSANTDPSGASAGIGIDTSSHVVVTGNRVTGNDTGVYLISTHATTVSSTTAQGNTYGLYVDSNSTGNTLSGDKALNSTVVDCEDDSTGTGTAGTANKWTTDIGAISVPLGICR